MARLDREARTEGHQGVMQLPSLETVNLENSSSTVTVLARL